LHVKNLLSRLNKALFAVGVISGVVGREASLVVYHAYFVSLVRYSIIFWGSSIGLNSVLLLQKRAIRHIFHLSYRTSRRPFFRNNGLLTVPAVYIHELAAFVYKNKRIYSEEQTTHRYNTRNNIYSYPRHSLTSFERGPYYMGMRIFNALPERITTCETIIIFKRELKIMLTNICPYRPTLEEFFQYQTNENGQGSR
jgi:hypothetical protein